MKFILFDCDGVLVDTEAVAAKVVTRWLNTCNCYIPEKEFMKQHSGKTFGAIFKELIENGSFSKDYWKDDTISKLEQLIYEQIVIVDGVKECLELLVPIEKAVVSNSRAIMVRKALEVTRLDRYLDVNKIISSEMVENAKPDPAVYLHALKTFNLYPDDCIAVEDSLTGVKASTGAGIKTIGFAGASHLQEGHDQRLLAEGASAIAYHASEIPSLIHQEMF
jgi:HAD superfamily hydrolase (TIGR01509 family)